MFHRYATTPHLAIRPTAGRRVAELAGRSAETLTAEQLETQGFTILARRLRTPAGEIDLVAATPHMLLFIEVKSRPSFREAAECLTPRQQARLYGAATIALGQNPGWARPDTRFDVALVAHGAVQMIEDAIRAC
ncbi:YraN family protein [Acidocella sp.]|uniref:YraN family protein n=1 Tax=Acidocella sp. TaxID=50710 RepID=UPI0026345D39|nr:YraN family protein [Acidocella sp.]